MEIKRFILDWLAKNKTYSTFDVKDGLYQVERHDKSKRLAGIRTVVGFWTCTRLPHGLKNAPRSFQRVLNSILLNRKGNKILTVVDDTSIGTETERKHLKYIHENFETKFRNKAHLKLSKCATGRREVEQFGHRTATNGVGTSHEHVKAIRELMETASGEELMRFLGLMN